MSNLKGSLLQPAETKDNRKRYIPENAVTDLKKKKENDSYTGLRITRFSHSRFMTLKQITQHKTANDLFLDMLENYLETLDEDQKKLYSVLRKNDL